MCCAVLVSPLQAENRGTVDALQKAISPIAAFAASGDPGKLKQALNEGLDAGLSVNEIKQIQLQLHAAAPWLKKVADNVIHSLSFRHTFIPFLLVHRL